MTRTVDNCYVEWRRGPGHRGDLVLGGQWLALEHHTSHAAVAGDDREQPPADTVAGYLKIGHEQLAAGPKVLRQAVHDPAGHHDVEVLGGQL